MNNGKGSDKNAKKSASKNKPKGKTFKKDDKKSTFASAKPVVERKPKQKKVTSLDEDNIRLNKYISNSGVCSRREADIYIVSGNVKVNGEVIVEMGYQVKPGDVVNFDGAVINPEKKVYVLLNKPKGFSTITEEIVSPENVLTLVKGASKSMLSPIGRMDKTTLGLLLFTNDTEMIQKFTTANQRSSKMYQVSLDKNLKYEDLEKLEKGLTLDGHKVYIEEINYVDDQPKTEIGIKLKATNVKTVRNLFESLNYNVLKVDRVVFAGLTKFNLPRGKWRTLTTQEIINLKNA
ncbi:pseudouridine synthase [Flavobacterium sp. JP2137]|uniref:pseudouridine synthase n=1 Tax=Flavobacterium sp. JP2137 TaxID=3414510 RepID=UPI003D2FC562